MRRPPAALRIAASGGCYALPVGAYDNDGDLDLYVSNFGGTDILYVNQGNGTFVVGNVGAVLTDGSRDFTTWVDYNNDGWLDLFKSCGDTVPTPNRLYRNSLQAAGTTNHWLKLKLEGVTSNRSAIGARIMTRALISGREVLQTRQGLSADCTPLRV